MYYKLALKKEQEALKKFPEQYQQYMRQTPMFFPKLTKLSSISSSIK
jgi:protein-S-isoprenylcysteine O-methyltransferase Ste14